MTPQPRRGAGRGGGRGRGGGGGARWRAAAVRALDRGRRDREQAGAAGDRADRHRGRQGRRVALSFGPQTRTETPLPELAAGDRLLAFAELELTTDAEDPNHPGRIGNAYSYSPKVEATLLLAADAGSSRRSVARRSSSAEGPGARRSATSATTRWSPSATPSCACPPAGCRGGARRTSTSSSAPATRTRGPATCCSSARTRRRRPWSRTWPGSGSCAFAPATPRSRPPSARRHACARRCRSPSSRPWSSRTSSPGSREGEQLLVRGRLVTDAAGLAAPARISTRIFLADRPDQTEPGGDGGGQRHLEGAPVEVHRLQLPPRRGPADLEQVRRRHRRARRPGAAST